jgi:hypothetical protein
MTSFFTTASWVDDIIESDATRARRQLDASGLPLRILAASFQSLSEIIDGHSHDFAAGIPVDRLRRWHSRTPA